MSAPELSLVIPLRDEESNVLPLYQEFTDVMQSLRRPYEAILVEDGSVDGTFADRKSTRLNSSPLKLSRMPSSA